MFSTMITLTILRTMFTELVEQLEQVERVLLSHSSQQTVSDILLQPTQTNANFVQMPSKHEI